MKPAIPCTDPAFKYTPSYETDLRKRFAQIKAEQAAAIAREKAGIPNVSQIKRRAK